MYKKIINPINSHLKKIVLLFTPIIAISLISQAGASTISEPLQLKPGFKPGIKISYLQPMLKAVNEIKKSTQQSSNEIRAAVQTYITLKYAPSGAGSGSAADWLDALKETTQNTKNATQKNVDNHFTQINNGILAVPDESVLGESGYTKPDSTSTFSPDVNLLAQSISIPGYDSIFKAGSTQANDLGNEVMKQLITQVNKHVKKSQQAKVSAYLTDLSNSPQNGSFNFSSLLSPKDDMYTDEESKVASNYLLMLNSDYSSYYDKVLQQLKAIGEHIPTKATNQASVVNYYVAIMGNKDVQQLLQQLRKHTVMKSIVSNTLQSLYQERKKLSTGKSQLAMEREAVMNADCSNGGDCQKIVLQQNFQAHLDSEHEQALLGVIAMNGLNSANLLGYSQLKKLNHVIKMANDNYEVK